MPETSITERAKRILATVPEGVLVVAAAKTRTPEEVAAAIEAGVRAVGHNYVQEAERMVEALGRPAAWHMIGHVQRNKAKKVAALFDVVETLDSMRLADALERHCAAMDKVLPVLIEINSGREASKTGVPPEKVGPLAEHVSRLPHLRLQGLMTMGPRFGNPEDARSYFVQTRETFERLAQANIPNVEMRCLSMGMSNSYRVALEEGANVVRLGTILFGEREQGNRDASK